MSQTNYSINTVNAFAGTLADLQNSTIRSYRAAENIPFGLGVAQGQVKASDARLPMINSVVLNNSADLVAANSTVGTVTVTTLVNGVRTVATTNLTATVFAVDAPTSLAALAAKIAAVSGVASAVANSPNKTITVLASPDTQVVLSGFVTTLGAGQPAYTYANSTTDVLLGVALFEQNIENDLVTGVAINAYPHAFNVLRRGAVFVTMEAATNPQTGVFWRFADGGAGKPIGGFSGTSAAGLNVATARGYFPDATLALAVGTLEISLP